MNDRRRHREVAQDKMERAVWGPVEVLLGVEGENVVRLPPLKVLLRHAHGGARSWNQRGPPAASR